MAVMVVSFRAQATTVGRGASTGLRPVTVCGGTVVGKSYDIITVGERRKRAKLALCYFRRQIPIPCGFNRFRPSRMKSKHDGRPDAFRRRSRVPGRNRQSVTTDYPV